MKKSDRSGNVLLVSGLSLVLACSTGAERILFLDAGSPGNNPNSQWDDLSSNGYHFVNSPSNSVAYNAANMSYDFDFGNRMDGIGDESLFDFDTAFGNPPNATPFSIVAYLQQDWAGGDIGEFILLSKTDEPANSQFVGWAFGGNPDASNRFDFFMQPGNNVNRLYSRTNNGLSGSPMLLVVTHTGSGFTRNVNWYVNGAQVTLINFDDALAGSITNDFHLVLGSSKLGSSQEDITGWRGSLFFLEIHDTVLTPAEVAARWNGGDVHRVIDTVAITDLLFQNVLTLHYPSKVGRVYILEATEDATAPFTPTGTMQVGNGQPQILCDPTLLPGSRIYRIIDRVQ
jgi:hypothetical protein